MLGTSPDYQADTPAGGLPVPLPTRWKMENAFERINNFNQFYLYFGFFIYSRRADEVVVMLLPLCSKQSESKFTATLDGLPEPSNQTVFQSWIIEKIGLPAEQDCETVTVRSHRHVMCRN